VDDLALLVELVSSGWRGVDGRLQRLERSQAEDAARVIAAIEDIPVPSATEAPSSEHVVAA
jgi:hypothetical protein